MYGYELIRKVQLVRSGMFRPELTGVSMSLCGRMVINWRVSGSILSDSCSAQETLYANTYRTYGRMQPALLQGLR